MEILLVMVLALSGAGGLYWYSSRDDAKRTRRVLRRTRVSRIADLVEGKLACVVGTVEADGELITAMISKVSCIAYDTTIQYFRQNDFSFPSRVEVARHMVPFFVTDATGRVRVDAPVAALCNRPIARNERFEERILEPGVTVRLVGSVRVDPAPAGSGERGFRDGTVAVTITGTARYPLLVDVENDKR